MRMKSKGNFNSTEKLLNNIISQKYLDNLNKIAKDGLDALVKATPVDTGKTASSWYYNISVGNTKTTITWSNSNLDSSGTPVVILIQHGHATNTGSYILGRDFINPALRPVFDSMLVSMRKALVS